MGDNLNIIQGTAADVRGRTAPLKTTETDGVHVPHVNIDGSGDAASQSTQLSVRDLMVELLVEQRITNLLLQQAFNLAPEGLEALRGDPEIRPVLSTT